MSKWVARGKSVRFLGYVPTENPGKAEKTIKSKSSSEKRAFIKRYGKKI